ncbi:HAD-IB family hydrolase [Streptomyces sp. SID486]|uniref:HAD family hydrolase n=1 Tax=Streptomyces sp. SID486 TaxID=2690264 RepID=UPI0031F5F43C
MAFFDVDETLISAKSMVAFHDWRFRQARGALPSLDEVVKSAGPGASRAELNRAYYRAFAGTAVADLAAAGRQWYDEYRRGAHAFVPAAVSALREHAAAGHLVVLVSGSHHACLDPLAEELGADRLLCTELRADAAGRLTGELARPMIGPAKAEAVRALLAETGVEARDCFAYGDHSSDLPLLQSVGSATVVGEDPVLLGHAAREGWARLPASAGPWHGDAGAGQGGASRSFPRSPSLR